MLRVEVGYEQLAEAEQLASALAKATGRETRILGWFHSHPHITVLPSHVDIQTQAQYQAMDAGFLGLICAVFQDDPKQQRGRVEITAFQSVPGGGGREGGRAVMMDLDDDFIRIDDEDSASYVHHGIGLELAGLETKTVRKGIPIALVPSARGGGGREGGKEGGGSDGPTTDAMRCVVSLQEVLMQEERYFYEAAAQTNLRNNVITTTSSSSSSSSRAGDVHALYNAAVYGKALSSLLEESAIPLIHTLESVLLNLRREKERVQRAVEKMEEDSRGSVSVAAGGLEGVMGVKKGGRKGRGESGMMDMNECQPSSSPYSSSVLAVSRPEILKKAAEGWQMRRMNGNGDDDVIVRLTREYPLLRFGGEGFGQWWLSVGEEKGRLTRIAGNGNGNHMVTFGFVPARPGGRDTGGEKEKETIVRVLGSQDAVVFWCRRVPPIVCPSANLLPAS
eukprot:evm.model.NODE_41946_length_18123_cov_25.350328.2